MLPAPGSFRDPSGKVYIDGDRIIRTINGVYQKDWEALEDSGLMRSLAEEGHLVGYHETPPLDGAWKSLEVEKVPFLSWPHEWCFSQLKDAALLTLNLQKLALEMGFVLKDASAYNVQFNGVKPVFIDLLSFERWQEGSPWEAYRQFCSHFLAPLALMAYLGPGISRISQAWIDGIPLSMAAKILPLQARLNPGLAMHLFMHASMSEKHADGRKSAKKIARQKVKKNDLLLIAESLERTVKRLSLPARESEWSAYYEDTNYSNASMEDKEKTVREWAAKYAGPLALDMGANTGRFSSLIAPFFKLVVSTDFDGLAIERNYRNLRKTSADILPLVLDLANPTPATGWGNQERSSFTERARFDFALALALCHHLVMTAGIPFPQIASWFSRIIRPGGALVVEFVPKEDSQVMRMLAARQDIFGDYSCETFLAAFHNAGFRHLDNKTVEGTARSLHLFQLQ